MCLRFAPIGPTYTLFDDFNKNAALAVDWIDTTDAISLLEDDDDTFSFAVRLLSLYS